MKKLFLLMTCMLFFAQVNAQSKFSEFNLLNDDSWRALSNVSAVYLSGDGEYATGIGTSTGESWIWNKTTGEITIINDTTNALAAISNNGTAVGTAKNPTLDPSNSNINAAVVYKNGEWNFLNRGGYPFAGSYGGVVPAISSDGKWAVGTIKKVEDEGGTLIVKEYEGIRWNLDDNSYTLLPNSAINNAISGYNRGGYPVALSNDGNVICGNLKGYSTGGSKPAVWESTDGTTFTVSVYGESDSLKGVYGEMMGVSPNGKYAVGFYNSTGSADSISVMLLWTKGSGFKAIPYTKEDENGKIVYMPRPRGIYVTNDGTVLGTTSNGIAVTSTYTGFYWTEEGEFKDLTEYFYEKGIPYPNANDIGNIKRVSEDGKTLSGVRARTSSQTVRPWIAIINDLARIYPAKDAENVVLDTNISLYVNVDITAADLTKVSVSPDPGNVVVSVVDNGRRLLITHDSLSYATEYTVTIGDGALTGITGDVIWKFTTQEPTIVEMIPVNNAKDVILRSPISVEFEDTGLVIGNLSTVTVSPNPGNVVATYADNKISITHDKLDYGTEYTVTIPKAEVGGFADDIMWSFTTISEPTIVEMIPAKNAKDIALRTPISIEFVDAELEIGDLATVTITPDPGNVVATYNDNKISITHNKLEYDTEYTVNIPAAEVEGFTEGITWKFTTILDTRVPIEPSDFYQYTLQELGGAPAGISPNGKYIVGNSNNTGSFIWNEGEIENITDGKIKLVSVSDDGVAVGTAIDSTLGTDPDYPESGVVYKDGEWYFLGLGDSASLVTDTRGSEPRKISGDGKTVVGRAPTSNKYEGIRWDISDLENISHKNYKNVNDNNQWGQITSVSSDGKIMVGKSLVENGSDTLRLWKNGSLTNVNITVDKELGFDSIIAIHGNFVEVSPNGKYATGNLNISGMSGSDVKSIGAVLIYSIENSTSRLLYDTINVMKVYTAISVNDAGEALLTVRDLFGGTMAQTNSFYCKSDTNALIALEEYLIGKGVEIPQQLASLGSVKGMSADGKVMFGTTSTFPPVHWVATIGNVSKYTPANQEEDVLADTEISIDFNISISEDDLSLISVTPEVDFTASIEDSKLIISHDGLEYNETYTITVPEGSLNEISGEITWSFSTKEVPVVTEKTPGEGSSEVALDAAVTVTFDRAVSSDDLSGITITPAVEGEDITASISGNTLTIEHPDFAYATEYTVMIPAGTLENQMDTISWSFTTEIEPVKPVAETFTPSKNAVDVALDATISIEFDIDIVLTDATKIKIEPAVANVSAAVTNSNKLEIAHDNLAAETLYTVTIEAGAVTGVKATNDEISWSFTTKGTEGISGVELLDSKVYPNPSEGLVNISGEGKSTVRIMDVAGRIVDTFEVNNNAVYNFTQKGMYLIQIENNGKKAIHKVVIK